MAHGFACEHQVQTTCSEAKEAARELYIEYKIRQKKWIACDLQKRFADVAAYCVADMQKQLGCWLG